MLADIKKTFKTLTRSLEALYVLSGHKPCARLDVYEDELCDIYSFCQKNSLNVCESDFKVIKLHEKNKSGYSNKGIKVERKSPDKGVLHLYISKSSETAEKAKLAEKQGDDSALGAILGYPNCCIDFFIKNKPIQEKKENDYILPVLKNSIGIVFPFYTNCCARYFDISLLSHFPCNFKCEESIKIAEKNLECIEKYSKKDADIILSVLKTAVLYTESEGVFILKSPRLEKNTMHYDKIIASAANPIYELLKDNNKIEIGEKHLLIGNTKVNASLMVFT